MLVDPNDGERGSRLPLREILPCDMMAAAVTPALLARTLREWRGLSQSDLADRSGLAVTQIARAERGCDTSPEVWRAIARTLHVEDALLKRGGDRRPGF